MTQFRAHCLELIRWVESGGDVVEITRHGKPVARLTPPLPVTAPKISGPGRSCGDPEPWRGKRRSRCSMPGSLVRVAVPIPGAINKSCVTRARRAAAAA